MYRYRYDPNLVIVVNELILVMSVNWVDCFVCYYFGEVGYAVGVCYLCWFIWLFVVILITLVNCCILVMLAIVDMWVTFVLVIKFTTQIKLKIKLSNLPK